MFKVRSKNKPGVIKTVYAAKEVFTGTIFLIYDEELDLWMWVDAESYIPHNSPVKKNVQSSDNVL